MSSWSSPVLRGLALMLGMAVMSSCGGGGGGGGSGLGGGGSGGGGTGGGAPPSGPNVAAAVVGPGPAGVSAINTLYTTVTVCNPGTTTCQTIDNIQVDTGSYGLRLLSSVLTLTLPVAQAQGGGALVECTEFVDGYSWGPVAVVDMRIAGEAAASLPVQLIGDPRYPQAPNQCSSTAPAPENTVIQFGANGILGIGPYAQDCGTFCVGSIPSPAQYWSCTTSIVCQGVVAPLSAQVTNPITLFAADSNGSIVLLPSVPETGAANVTGYLIFGVDTESNNMSGNQTVLPIASSGYLTTVFGGQSFSQSFIDSGSNGDYFADSSLTACPTSSGQTFAQFYCPPSPVTLTASFVLPNNSTVNESLLVANADTISTSDTAYPGLAGTNSTAGSFDWGLPFFYGRRVANVIEGASTSVGTGPYVAF